MLLDLMDALKHQGDSRPFKISGCLPEDLLPEDIKITSPVQVEGTMTAFGHDVAIVGEVTAQIQTQCCLCLKPMSIKLSLDYDELLRRQGQGYVGLGDDDEDDVEFEELAQEVIFFDGNTCEVSESVANALTMFLPMRHVCMDGCKGICSGCGADLNSEECTCDGKANSAFSALASLFTEEE